MADHQDHGFSANKILLGLVILTAVEVAWSFLPFARWAVWGGLLIFAFWKAFLIFTYFMHMRFEGWIVKGFVLPVIPLMAIVVFATMPDVSYNEELKYPIGSRVDRETGLVEMYMDPRQDPGRRPAGDVAVPAAEQ